MATERYAPQSRSLIPGYKPYLKQMAHDNDGFTTEYWAMEPTGTNCCWWSTAHPKLILIAKFFWICPKKNCFCWLIHLKNCLRCCTSIKNLQTTEQSNLNFLGGHPLTSVRSMIEFHASLGWHPRKTTCRTRYAG